MNMENIKHNRQPITEEMVCNFMNTYRLATKEDAEAWILKLMQTNDEMSKEVISFIMSNYTTDAIDGQENK